MKTKIWTCAATLILLLSRTLSVNSQVVLSEIMFNAPVSEYYEEFIELHNASPSEEINLSGYSVGDQQEQDFLIDTNGGYSLLPGGFALILDPGYWENSSIYDSLIPPETLILTIDDNAFGAFGLRNDPPDSVILKDPQGETIASFAYTSGNEDGYSEEKIRLNLGDDPQNWANSITYLGTPGSANSVQPPNLDLALVNLSVSPSPLPYASPLDLSCSLMNQGMLSTSACEIIFASGSGDASTPDFILGSESVPAIPPNDSSELTLSLEGLPAGPHGIFSWHTLADENPENDTLNCILPGGYPEKTLIINEIYPRPLEGQCEWVEFYNPGEACVNLWGFTLCDEDTSDRPVLIDSSMNLLAGEFVIAAADSCILELPLPENIAVVILGSDWPILNNDGDTPSLFDAAGGSQDAVPYSDWDIPAGISLERISADQASDDPANWQPSIDSTGSTPGRTNSTYQYPGSGFPSGDLTFNPNPFDPDQHGFLQISVILPPDAVSAAVVVFDLRGRKLRSLLDDDVPTGMAELFWDGRDMKNRRLSPGLYVLFTEFRDGGGSRKQVIKKTLVIAGKL